MQSSLQVGEADSSPVDGQILCAENGAMIFGNESIATFSRTNVMLWMVLAFQAGMLNVGGFLACHGFVSHVTGYATLFAVQAYQANYVMAAEMLMVPTLFLVGAMLSGFLVDHRLKRGLRPGYFVAFGVLFFLLLSVVVAGFNHAFGAFGDDNPLLLAMLCLVCGVQNGLVTLVSRAVVRTTHLTGITTDLGIGLVRVALGGGGADEGRANLMRMGIILFFILGSAVGTATFVALGYRGFLVPTVISGTLFLLATYFQVLRSN